MRYDGGDAVLHLTNLFTETRDRSPAEAQEWLAVDETDYLSSWILVPDWLLVSTANFELDITGIAPMPGVHPPRYRTGRWPDAAVFDRLTQVAVAF